MGMDAAEACYLEAIAQRPDYMPAIARLIDLVVRQDHPLPADVWTTADRSTFTTLYQDKLEGIVRQYGAPGRARAAAVRLMKRRNKLRQSVFAAILFFVTTLPLLAAGLDLDFALGQSAIYPQSPLELSLGVHLSEAEVGRIQEVSVHIRDINMSTILSVGNVVQQPPPFSVVLLKRNKLISAHREPLDASDGKTHTPFGKWCSTNLPAGEYTVVIELTQFGVLEQRPSGRSAEAFAAPIVATTSEGASAQHGGGEQGVRCVA